MPRNEQRGRFGPLPLIILYGRESVGSLKSILNRISHHERILTSGNRLYTGDTFLTLTEVVRRQIRIPGIGDRADTAPRDGHRRAGEEAEEVVEYGKESRDSGLEGGDGPDDGAAVPECWSGCLAN